MEELHTTQTASVFASKVNTNFGGTVISIDDTAADAVSDLNTAFGGASGTSELSEDSSADDFVNALNTNFAAYNNERTSLKFLHLSDPHGYYDAAQLCKEKILADSDYEFLFITGDMTRYAYSTISDELLSQMDTLKGRNKLLLLAGNHDTYDNKFGTNAASQQATTQFLLSYLGNNVTWGDTRSGAEKVASYWHKDFIIGSHKLRIISIDQYETSLRPNYTYFTMYTQAQVDWFIARLKELNAGDYLIIATHEPPVQSRTVPQGGGSGDTAEDSYAVGLRPSSNADTAKLFVTEGLRAFGNRRSEPNWNLLPQIMRAYLNGEHLVMSYKNYGAQTADINIDEDFSLVTPATFLFYMGGHRHADICTYLPDESSESKDGGDWSDQLMLYITAADRSVSWQYDDDLGGSSNWLGTPSVQSTDKYRFNEVTLDFIAKTITVRRYGDQKTYGGRVRNEVVFPFVKGGES